LYLVKKNRTGVLFRSNLPNIFLLNVKTYDILIVDDENHKNGKNFRVGNRAVSSPGLPQRFHPPPWLATLTWTRPNPPGPCHPLPGIDRAAWGI